MGCAVYRLDEGLRVMIAAAASAGWCCVSSCANWLLEVLGWLLTACCYWQLGSLAPTSTVQGIVGLATS